MKGLDRFAQKMQDHVRERKQSSCFFLSTLLERLSSSDASTRRFQWGSQPTVFTSEVNRQFIKRLSDWLRTIQEINKWINNLWESINIFSFSTSRANTPVDSHCFTRSQQRCRKGSSRQMATATCRDKATLVGESCFAWQISILHFISQERDTCIGLHSQQTSN